jgi:TPR repeat protein
VASDEENEKRMMERIKANDPAAICHMGGRCLKEGDYDAALKYLTKAAELGNLDAHYRLGMMYCKGPYLDNFDVENEEKMVYHWEKAAIGGHPLARHTLAVFEKYKGTIERSVKHFMIAANLGLDDSMKELWKEYSAGNITKEDLDATLRTHHAALEEMKSAQRDIAHTYYCN